MERVRLFFTCFGNLFIEVEFINFTGVDFVRYWVDEGQGLGVIVKKGNVENKGEKRIREIKMTKNPSDKTTRKI